MDTSIPSGGCLVHNFYHEGLLSAAMHPVVDTMAFADTVTWYLLYLRFSVGLKP